MSDGLRFECTMCGKCCTNHGECHDACPKDISLDYIAMMNADYLKSKIKNRKLTGRR